MGVLRPAAAVVLSLICILGITRGQKLDEPQPPSIEIGVQVTSNRQKSQEDNQEFLVLVDTWWKILAWSLAVLVLSCLCCYFSRCCYLCWDCCSDPFWGCCPQSQGCRRFLLMKGCCTRKKIRIHKKGSYTVCETLAPEEDEETGNIAADDLSDEADFTLRTVESLEVDAMLDKFTPIKGLKNNSSTKKGKIVTSTPRKPRPPKKEKKDEDRETEAIFLELSGEAESMPQFYPTHYFNILNIFGVGCSNYKVSSVAEHHRKFMQETTMIQQPTHSSHINTTTISSGKMSHHTTTANEGSTIGLVSDDEEDRSFDRSVINNQDFPLSSSFSNMYKKNGLHIEEGRIGRYNPLPEAQFELLPPADFLRRIKRQNSTAGMHRRSRSMETFRNHPPNSSKQISRKNSKKFASGQIHQKYHAGFSDEDESMLPSPPPVPSSSGKTKPPRMTCTNGNMSSTTTDEELELLTSQKHHKRAHSEGSRIGHRRTPSMEGVAQMQNGGVRHVKAGRHQSTDLPPKGPSNHKKRYSHRRMKLLDIEGDDIERCILYGKETTL